MLYIQNCNFFFWKGNVCLMSKQIESQQSYQLGSCSYRVACTHLLWWSLIIQVVSSFRVAQMMAGGFSLVSIESMCQYNFEPKAYQRRTLAGLNGVRAFLTRYQDHRPIKVFLISRKVCTNDNTQATCIR